MAWLGKAGRGLAGQGMAWLGMSDYPRLAEHNRMAGVGQVGADADVLCDLCGSMMHFVRGDVVIGDPVCVPVRCRGCRYRGAKACLSRAEVDRALAAALEPEPEPVREPPPD